MATIIKFLQAVLNIVPGVLAWWAQREAEIRAEERRAREEQEFNEAQRRAAERARLIHADPAHEWLRGFNPGPQQPGSVQPTGGSGNDTNAANQADSAAAAPVDEFDPNP